MLTPFSQVETAFRDTLITKAQGVALDTLGRMYGFPRLGIFERKYYRRALQEIAFGRRGTYPTFFRALEHLFDQYSERRGIINVTLDPAYPNSLVYREGGAPTFDCASVQRFVRIVSPTFGSKIYYSQGIENGRLKLNPIETPSVAGADWSTLASSEQATAKMLGFMLHERHPGPPSVDGADINDNPWHPLSYLEEKTCTIDLSIDSFLWSTPATYMQEDGSIDRTLVAPNQPYGGHLMSLYDAANRVVIEYTGSGVASETHLESGDQDSGPYPIYLDAEGKIAGAFIDALDGLLAAGVHLNAEIKDWCENFGSVVFNPFDGNFDLGNGEQALPPNWDFNAHGVPRSFPNRAIEAAEHVNEFFILEDAQSNRFYLEEKANLSLSNTGKVILDSDTYYHLITLVSGSQVAVTLDNADDVLEIDKLGRITDTQGNVLCTVPMATFVDGNGKDSSDHLGTVSGTSLRTQTSGSGTPVIQEPGATRSDNDASTPATITRLLPRNLDFFEKGVAGYFQLRNAAGTYFWSQDVNVALDGSRNLTTAAGIPFYPTITVPANVDALVIKEDAKVYADSGQGETLLGTLNVGIFPNPRGLSTTDNDHVFLESTSSLQPIEHRRSGAATVGAGFATATRGRLRINARMGEGLVLLNGQNNRLQVVPK